jgi:hypothetical protein
MSEITCPFCCATLFDSELTAGECTSCTRRLPPRLGQAGVRGWSAMGRPDDGQDWEWVRSGVGVLAGAAFLLVGASLALVGGNFQKDPGLLAIFLLLAGGLAALMAGVLWLVGLTTSLLCPRRAGLRGLAISTAGCVILGVVSPVVLMPVLERVIQDYEVRRILAELIAYGGALSDMAAIVLFFLYLRGVARHFGDVALGGLLLTYVLVFVAVVVGGVAAGILINMTRLNIRMYWRDWEMFMGYGFGMGGLALLIWPGILLMKLRAVIPIPTVTRRKRFPGQRVVPAAETSRSPGIIERHRKE